ncbi:MAG: glutaminyl-peptide cyclotransferase [Peptoniphilaceae bacterium]|nr:glutaminyl-peptide cyclotransferase [Peptoniphilaceae bacterium]MDY6085475.1 glutaminyl-peptide cyclotransferase [Peptoniphilaceae bacterium]
MSRGDFNQNVPAMRRKSGVLLTAGLFALAAGALFLWPHPKAHAYPMQEDVFVEGAGYVDGDLVLSSGGYGNSYIGRLVDGRVTSKLLLPEPYFAEGFTQLGEKVYWLTWQDHTAFVLTYENGTFTASDTTFTYPTEGWGLTNDGEHLWMSDGSSTLHVIDPKTFEDVRRLSVTMNGAPVDQLNELEYVDGFLYANVWMETVILKIDAQTGEVVKRFDLDALAQESAKRGDSDSVLNGIAHIEGDDFYLFGKNWTNYYRVTLR